MLWNFINSHKIIYKYLLLILQPRYLGLRYSQFSTYWFIHYFDRFAPFIPCSQFLNVKIKEINSEDTSFQILSFILCQFFLKKAAHICWNRVAQRTALRHSALERQQCEGAEVFLVQWSLLVAAMLKVEREIFGWCHVPYGCSSNGWWLAYWLTSLIFWIHI